MSKKARVYAKLIVIIAASIALFTVIFMNRNNRTDIWLFGNFKDIGVLWIILITAILTLILERIIKFVLKTMAELYQLQQPTERKDTETHTQS